MQHTFIIAFHKAAPGQIHASGKFTGGPKATHTFCGMDIDGMSRMAPFDIGDPRGARMFDDICAGCGDKFQI